MHRLFGLLAMTAAGFGLFLLLGPDTEPASTGAKAADNAPIAYSVWALGLLMGLTLAWLAGVEWSTLPERVGDWVRLQRRRVGWVVVGGACAASAAVLVAHGQLTPTALLMVAPISALMTRSASSS